MSIEVENRPNAKLVAYYKSARGHYWDRFEFECVECGEHYFRGANTKRINPYCGNCSRKHQKERDELNKKRKQIKHDNAVLDKLWHEVVKDHRVLIGLDELENIINRMKGNVK